MMRLYGKIKKKNDGDFKSVSFNCEGRLGKCYSKVYPRWRSCSRTRGPWAWWCARCPTTQRPSPPSAQHSTSQLWLWKGLLLVLVNKYYNKSEDLLDALVFNSSKFFSKIRMVSKIKKNKDEPTNSVVFPTWVKFHTTTSRSLLKLVDDGDRAW